GETHTQFGPQYTLNVDSPAEADLLLVDHPDIVNGIPHRLWAELSGHHQLIEVPGIGLQLNFSEIIVLLYAQFYAFEPVADDLKSDSMVSGSGLQAEFPVGAGDGGQALLLQPYGNT